MQRVGTKYHVTDVSDVWGDHLVLWGRVVMVVRGGKQIDKYTIYCLVSRSHAEL